MKSGAELLFRSDFQRNGFRNSILMGRYWQPTNLLNRLNTWGIWVGASYLAG
jgi:hypothetical protein